MTCDRAARHKRVWKKGDATIEFNAVLEEKNDQLTSLQRVLDLVLRSSISPEDKLAYIRYIIPHKP